MILIYYDFETCIIKKGTERRDTIPIELALFEPVSSSYYCSKIDCRGGRNESIEEFLISKNHKLVESLHCIAKVGGLHDASMLDVVRGGVRDYLSGFSGGICLVAHNGKSFDDHIFRGYFSDVVSSFGLSFKDSIGMLKKIRPGLKSYSLPLLTRRHQKTVMDYMVSRDMGDDECRQQHRALYDVVALHHVIEYARECSLLDDFADGFARMEISPPSSRRRDSWQTISGIGPKTSTKLSVTWGSICSFKDAMRGLNDEDVKSELRKVGIRRYCSVLRVLRSRP